MRLKGHIKMKFKIISRKKKFVYNTLASIINQILLIVSGFLLPRAMLSVYGSEINGLVSSITQFLGFISFMQAGVGVVVQAAFYKPLSNYKMDEISKIYCSAQRFFRRIAIVFVFYSIGVSIIYPFVTNSSLKKSYVSLLVLVISINLFAQYYFGLTNSLLLNAAQKAYIPLFFQTIVTMLNVAASVFLIYSGKTILIVKLVSNIICLINPIGLTYYVRKNYNIDLHIKYNKEPIKQKWSGFAQHISAVIVDNTDIIILTIFTSLADVSVYYVYYIVVNAIKQLLMSLTGGVQSLFGDMLARDEMNHLNKIFGYFEIIFGYMTTFLYSACACLIVPFVKVYTSGINDINYNVPLFAILITIAYAIFCYRTIYYILIKAAGHFKQTQFGAIFEAILNVLISIVVVIKFGLVGVVIGTLIAVGYRTLYCVWYLSNNIVFRSPCFFIKNICINMIVGFLCYMFSMYLQFECATYIEWGINALIVAVLVFGILTIAYICTYKREISDVKKFIYQYIRKKE
jgi:O-antigen/teichoic acid export membrane protein